MDKLYLESIDGKTIILTKDNVRTIKSWMDETKVFENENNRMLMVFATGLIDYCSKRNSCEGCVFEKKHICQIDYPECWILAEKDHDA